MDIGEFLDRAGVAPHASASSKRQAIQLLADMGARRLGLPAHDLFQALWAREAEGSTGIGSGVAVPHAHVAGLDRVRGLFVRLETPVEFGAVDDQPVDLMFALFSPPAAETEHLRALARVSRALRQTDLREQLRQARSADAVHALLAAEARPSAA